MPGLGPFKVVQPLADGLGVVAEETGDVSDAAVAELEDLNGSVAPPVFLGEPVGELPQLPRDVFGGRVHVTLREAYQGAQVILRKDGESGSCCGPYR